MKAYCFSCRAHKTFRKGEEVMVGSDKSLKALKGICPTCKKPIYHILERVKQ